MPKTDDRQKIVAYLPTDQHRALKMLAIERGCHMQDLIIDALKASNPSVFAKKKAARKKARK